MSSCTHAIAEMSNFIEVDNYITLQVERPGSYASVKYKNFDLNS